MYFRDPVAEKEGIMDGIIDLGLVQKVNSVILPINNSILWY